MAKKLGAVVNTPLNDIYIHGVYHLKLIDGATGPIRVDFNSTITKDILMKSIITYNKGKLLTSDKIPVI